MPKTSLLRARRAALSIERRAATLRQRTYRRAAGALGSDSVFDAAAVLCKQNVVERVRSFETASRVDAASSRAVASSTSSNSSNVLRNRVAGPRASRATWALAAARAAASRDSRAPDSRAPARRRVAAPCFCTCARRRRRAASTAQAQLVRAFRLALRRAPTLPVTLHRPAPCDMPAFATSRSTTKWPLDKFV